MSSYSLDLTSSLNELGLIITNVRSLANMDANPEENRRESNRGKKPDKKHQTTGANNQQQSKSSSPGQNGKRLVKDERGNTRTQTLARSSYGSSTSFGVRQRSIWNKSSTSGKKRNRKNTNHLLELRETNPSTSITHADSVDERDVDVEDDFETCDIDCSPYNNVNDVETWIEDESEREERDGSRSRGGFGSFQPGRSRRTVSPYPYRVKLKKQNDEEWAASCDPWEEGGFHDDDELRASGLTEINQGSGFREENPYFRFHADASMEDRLDELHLQEQYTMIAGDHDKDLKPCLKKTANSDDHRHAMNVSWNDDNNEFDVAAEDDNSHNAGVEDNAQYSSPAEEHFTEISDVSLRRPDGSQDSVELPVMTTPVNSVDDAVNLEVDVNKVETRTREVHVSPTSDDVSCHGDVDAIQYPETETDAEIKGDDTKCRPSNDAAIHPRTLLEEWTDDAISHLSNDEKYRLMKEQEHLRIERYDDPHLCRADRIKLLWEDCARKELLLHKLRPHSAAKTDVNRYNLYNY